MSRKLGVLHRVVNTLATALEALGHQPDPVVLECLGTTVHVCMSEQGRNYHRTEHVFDLFQDARANPIRALAAMFHDTVRRPVSSGPA